jgi:hypothetical protein
MQIFWVTLYIFFMMIEIGNCFYKQIDLMVIIVDHD